MKTLRIAVLAAAAAVAVPSLAFAQDQQSNQPAGTVSGVVGGAAVGAVVGGPIGAVVGAGVGAIVGSSLPPQPSVVYSGPVVIGQPLPETVTVYPIPQYSQYEYAVINNQRVIIDARTRRIVRVAG
jgi:Protein of unknown function (DUF1236)